MRLLVVIPPLPGPPHWLASAKWYLREENHAAPDSTPMPPHFAPAILGVVRQRLGEELEVKVLDGLLKPFTHQELVEVARDFRADAAFVLAGLDLLRHDCSFAALPCPSFVQITPVTVDPLEALERYELQGEYFIYGGETEATLAEALWRLSRGQSLEDCPGLVINSAQGPVRTPAPPVSDMSSFALPAYDLFDIPAYLEHQRRIEPRRAYHDSALIKTMKGCLFSCTFCTCSSPGQHPRYKSPAQVVEELKLLKQRYEVKRVVFIDPEFGVDVQRAKEICRGMIREGLGMRFLICNRVELIDEQLLELLRQAGCEKVRYGIETADPLVMARINKKINLPRAADAIRRTRAAGLEVDLFFLVGLPGETDRTIYLNAKFIVATQADNYSVGRLFLIPNTRLYEEMKAAGRILEWDWERYRKADTYQFHHEHYPDLASIDRAYRRLLNLINSRRLTTYRKGPLNQRLFLFIGALPVFSLWLRYRAPRLHSLLRRLGRKLLRVPA